MIVLPEARQNVGLCHPSSFALRLSLKFTMHPKQDPCSHALQNAQEHTCAVCTDSFLLRTGSTGIIFSSFLLSLECSIILPVTCRDSYPRSVCDSSSFLWVDPVFFYFKIFCLGSVALYAGCTTGVSPTTSAPVCICVLPYKVAFLFHRVRAIVRIAICVSRTCWLLCFLHF